MPSPSVGNGGGASLRDAIRRPASGQPLLPPARDARPASGTVGSRDGARALPHGSRRARRYVLAQAGRDAAPVRLPGSSGQGAEGLAHRGAGGGVAPAGPRRRHRSRIAWRTFAGWRRRLENRGSCAGTTRATGSARGAAGTLRERERRPRSSRAGVRQAGTRARPRAGRRGRFRARAREGRRAEAEDARRRPRGVAPPYRFRPDNASAPRESCRNPRCARPAESGALVALDPAPAARTRWWRNRSGDVRGPVVHQDPAPVEQVAAPVGGLDTVTVDVGKRELAHLARRVGALRRPVPEA